MHGVRDKVISARKYFSDRTHLRRYMLDAVQDPSGLIAENDIAVLAHDFNDQCLLADITELIQMLKLNVDYTL